MRKSRNKTNLFNIFPFAFILNNLVKTKLRANIEKKKKKTVLTRFTFNMDRSSEDMNGGHLSPLLLYLSLPHHVSCCHFDCREARGIFTFSPLGPDVQTIHSHQAHRVSVPSSSSSSQSISSGAREHVRRTQSSTREESFRVLNWEKLCARAPRSSTFSHN